jgi:hypothetical protein
VLDKLEYSLPALACALFFASPAAAEMLNNESVIALVGAGIGNDSVIAKIESTPGSYAPSRSHRAEECWRAGRRHRGNDRRSSQIVTGGGDVSDGRQSDDAVA